MDPRWSGNNLEEKFDALGLPFVFTYTGDDSGETPAIRYGLRCFPWHASNFLQTHGDFLV